MKLFSPLFYALPFLGLGLSSSLAQSVNWGTSGTAVPAVFLSDGTADTNQVLVWQLGYFADQTTEQGTAPFMPTADNVLDWKTYWRPVSSMTYENTGDPDFPIWGAVQTYPTTPDNPANPFVPAAVGKQAWTFAFNDINLMGTTTGEALLYNQGATTVFPAQNVIDFDIADADGDPADNTFNVVWGAVDRLTGSVGGYQVGPGSAFGAPHAESTNNDPFGYGGTFEAQTGTWLTNVPEPTTTLMSLMGCTLLLGRRRRAR